MHRRAILSTPALALAGWASGCSLSGNTSFDGPSAPRFSPWAPQSDGQNRRFRLALVLSSGGPRGFVHVGVLKALDELRIQPDLVLGSSVGALVGALYAGGVSAREIERLALTLGPTDFVRFNAVGAERFSGTALASLVNEQLGGRPMERLPTAFAAVVIERETREAACFNAGDAGLAVQAAAAIEGRFSPVIVRGRAYLDSDLVLPLPVRLAKTLGADKVISVDASAHEDKAPESAARFRAGDVLKRALTQPDAQAANLNLHPEFGYYVSVTQEFRLRAIAAGYATTMAQAKTIAALAA